MTVHNSQQDLQEAVRIGERIYAEKFKKEFEARFPDQYAVIDIDAEDAVIGEHAENAVLEANRKFGTHRQHLIRIGSPSAVQLSFFYPNAHLAWAL